MSAYAVLVNIRALFSMLIAVALLVAPAATAAHGMTATTDHHQQMTAMKHCQSTPSDSQDKAPDKSCCIAMCTAVAMAPAEPADAALQGPSPTYFAAPQFWRGYLGEIATPPPRRA